MITVIQCRLMTKHLLIKISLIFRMFTWVYPPVFSVIGRYPVVFCVVFSRPFFFFLTIVLASNCSSNILKLFFAALLVSSNISLLYRHDITEILLKVAFYTINLTFFTLLHVHVFRHRGTYLFCKYKIIVIE